MNRHVMLAGIATVLAGCAGGPPAAPMQQDLTFARGCWINRVDGSETKTVRDFVVEDLKIERHKIRQQAE